MHFDEHYVAAASCSDSPHPREPLRIENTVMHNLMTSGALDDGDGDRDGDRDEDRDGDGDGDGDRDGDGDSDAVMAMVVMTMAMEI